MKKIKKQKQHYVDNQEFLAAIIKYKERVYNAAVKEIEGLADMDPDEQFQTLKSWKSKSKPRVGNYIGSCFLKIATHLSYRPNFINYMYKDDMVCDGIENCIQSVSYTHLTLPTTPYV